MTREILEPAAQSYLNSIGRGDAPATATCAEAYGLSTAISLKRIADALDRYALAAELAVQQGERELA